VGKIPLLNAVEVSLSPKGEKIPPRPEVLTLRKLAQDDKGTGMMDAGLSGSGFDR